MKRRAAMLVAMLLASAPVGAAPCPLPGEAAMLTVRLYFGQSEDGRPIAPSAWRDFVAREVTPKFPGGFTVFDAVGQWRDAQSRGIVRETSKVIEIAAPDTPALRTRINEIRKNYIARFHQDSVGLLTIPGCGTF